MSQNEVENLDVLIIGAGISGLGMAYNLQLNRPNDSFVILESRENIGGTWDYFKYPGIRSDSDMYTFAYSFKPWRHREYIGSAKRIKDYLNELVEENNIKSKIRFRQKVVSSQWQSPINRWVVTVQVDENEYYVIHAKFLVTCTGYYNYEHGYLPEFAGYEDFTGDIIHPQQWPENYDYHDKKVIVIGSGATAITVVPAMAEEAAHVTMVQRSPSYIYARPAADSLFRFLSKFLSPGVTNAIMRTKYVCLQQFSYGLSKLFPNFVRKSLLKTTRKAVDDKIDVNLHFNPNYAPWDQRVCMVPDNDLFECIKQGTVSVETDEIERFTESGLRLKSGKELTADLIVTATGLDVKLWGGMTMKVDDQEVIPNSLTNYKGMMFSQMPNLVTIFGYTNTSWTVKAELTYDYVCRLLDYMEKEKHSSVFPFLKEPSKAQGLVALKSGYILRAQHKLPKQGESFPWCNKDFYFADFFAIKHSKLDDGILKFDDNSHLLAFHKKAVQ